MKRLTEKGLLQRRKDGRAYLYTPATSENTAAGSFLSALVQRLYREAIGEAIAHLLEEDSGVDMVELDRLEEIIQEKRQGMTR